MIKIESYGKKATRNGYGDAMLELGRQNPNVVALCADLVGSLKIQSFIDEFPERLRGRFRLRGHSLIFLRGVCMTRFVSQLPIRIKM